MKGGENLFRTCLYEEEMKAQEYVYFTLGMEKVPVTKRNNHNRIWDYYVPGKIIVMDFSSDGSYNFSDLRYRSIENEPKIILPESEKDTKELWELFGDSICFHFHNHIEIDCVATGEMVYVADGQVIHLKPDEMIVLQNGVPHAWRAVTEDTFVRHINISVEGFIQKNDLFRDERNLCTRLANGYTVLKISGSDKNHRQLLHVFENAISEQKHKEIGYRSVVRSETAKLLFLLGRYFYRNEELQYESRAGSAGSSDLKRVIDYINEHIDSEVTLEAAADIVHMNRTYFSVYFKQEMGMGFNDFVTKTRMAKAADLLLNTDSKITSIVSDCGYSSISHFNKVFKGTYFTTPSNFRTRGRDAGQTTAPLDFDET